WSQTHACRFDVAKFQLVHFARTPSQYEALPLVLDGITIQLSDTALYLGIVIDRWWLRWRQQVERAKAKATAATLAIARLARPTFGLPHKYARQLYISVVVP
ncbi:uncharacterized protein SCHCODRAFT_02478170, partial [Schizophyllum commune H4-8]|uniref:uncharacterized protein n=1 Tax=Schizophyllum commune (strain H4-8 / FGSC 9210) TaxID=578458 RepID=UPI00215E2228